MMLWYREVEMSYKARIVADSISEIGIRLTTVEVTFPRFVLAEFNTHRVFTRNSSSSRAIPVEKVLKNIEDNPFIPIYWGKNQKGMVAEFELDELTSQEAKKEWLLACQSAIKHARNLMQLGVHKQIANRLLEPFMWQTVLCSATEWSNFFALRDHPDAQPEIKRAAALMKEALSESRPMTLKAGEWHLPLISEQERVELSAQGLDLQKISVGRCCRVSYLTHNGVRDPMADIALADRLQADGHFSPFEHVATPMLTDEFCGNFRGWKQYRKDIPFEYDYSKQSG